MIDTIADSLAGNDLGIDNTDGHTTITVNGVVIHRAPGNSISPFCEWLLQVRALVEAVRKFNGRVMAGAIRSKRTFNEFCEALAALPKGGTE